ncbi:ASZ1 family protein [Megaselia abdita]
MAIYDDKPYYGPPPDSDSDESYEGFYFGDDHIDKRANRRAILVINPDQELFDAAMKGNVEDLKKTIKDLVFDVNTILETGQQTLLHTGCRYANVDIVRYLLENGANPNRQVDSYTPLMEACCISIDKSKEAKEIVDLLLHHRVVVNVSDKYGATPFMMACKNGHIDVVKKLAKLASMEASDNNGTTPLLYAIENNQQEIIKILLEEGANINICNRKGYSPSQVAQFFGFYDILDLLPKEDQTYCVPTTFLCYNSLCDVIPRIFLKSDVPEYFQEVTTILRRSNLEQFLDIFAQSSVSLAQFLIMDDEKLKAIGIELPLHRQKILTAILNFHLNHWSKKSIAKVKRKEPDSFYDLLMLSANHLQNIVVINSTLQFIKSNILNEKFGCFKDSDLQKFKESLVGYRKSLKEIRKTVKYLQGFSPEKSPLYIDYEEYCEEKRKHKVRRCIKYTLFIGISIVIFLKIGSVIIA